MPTPEYIKESADGMAPVDAILEALQNGPLRAALNAAIGEQIENRNDEDALNRSSICIRIGFSPAQQHDVEALAGSLEKLNAEGYRVKPLAFRLFIETNFTTAGCGGAIMPATRREKPRG